MVIIVIKVKELLRSSLRSVASVLESNMAVFVVVPFFVSACAETPKESFVDETQRKTNDIFRVGPSTGSPSSYSFSPYTRNNLNTYRHLLDFFFYIWKLKIRCRFFRYLVFNIGLVQ